MKTRKNKAGWVHTLGALGFAGGFLLHAAVVQAEPMYALTSNQQLIFFDTSSPSTIVSAHFVRNLQAGEQLLEIDYRSTTDEIVGLGSFGNLYVINPANGAAKLVTASSFSSQLNGVVADLVSGSTSFSSALNGITFGMDFDPVSDTLRIASNLGQNLTVNPNDGTILSMGSPLRYDVGDLLAGRTPNIQAIAFGLATENLGSRLYMLDSAHNTLAVEDAVRNGVLHTEAFVGVPSLRRFSGFDISMVSGAAFASVEAGVNGLFQVDLETGLPIFLGNIGAFPDNLLVYGITVIPEPSTLALFSLFVLGASFFWRRTRRAAHPA